MSARGFRIFNLLGFEIRIDVSWIILALLIASSLAMGYFPVIAEQIGYDAGAVAFWWMGVGGALGLALSIVLHELAHSLIARFYNIPINSITLFIFGGVADLQFEPKTAKSEFFMAIAGPAASLVLGGLFVSMAQIMPWPPATIVFSYLGLINFILAIFNMVPAFPLDGGRVLRAILWAWKKDLLWATRIATYSGLGFGYVLMALGAYQVIIGQILAGLWWILIGFFLKVAASESYRSLQSKVKTDYNQTDKLEPRPASSLDNIP